MNEELKNTAAAIGGPIKPKRTRKAPTPRARKPKDPGILLIEQEAAKRKEEYRKAQESEGILKRIADKLVPRLTEAHRQRLYDSLSKTETPVLGIMDSGTQ